MILISFKIFGNNGFRLRFRYYQTGVIRLVTVTKLLKLPFYISMCLCFVFMGVPGLLIVSCNNNDGLVTPAQYRISWIHSDSSLQLFEYDS